jgi:hypothetical protein
MPEEPADDLPPELGAFLYSCIESIEHVELLVMLRGAERPWAARDVAAALRVPVPRARRDLETLAARGLLEVRVGEETSYRYRPKTEEFGRYCDLLAQHYVTSRQAVLRFVASESRLSIKRFADAFRLRDPEKRTLENE